VVKAAWAEGLADQQEGLAVETTHHLAGLQHLAHLKQEDSVPQPAVLVQHQRPPQVGLAEAALEAHLQQQHPQGQQEDLDRVLIAGQEQHPQLRQR
jgi:hypothetical protein